MAGRDMADYGYACLPCLTRPESRGFISLRSNDPFDYPVIQTNYLKHQEDIELLIRGGLHFSIQMKFL